MLLKSSVCKVILACHDDNGHLGWRQHWGLLQERFFWPKMADDVCIHICTCDHVPGSNNLRKYTEMQPIMVSYPLELIHLDFLTLGGKAD